MKFFERKMKSSGKTTVSPRCEPSGALTKTKMKSYRFTEENKTYT
jgi:hypothetical protein